MSSAISKLLEFANPFFCQEDNWTGPSTEELEEPENSETSEYIYVEIIPPAIGWNRPSSLFTPLSNVAVTESVSHVQWSGSAHRVLYFSNAMSFRSSKDIVNVAIEHSKIFETLTCSKYYPTEFITYHSLAQKPLEVVFQELARQWRDETAMLSSPQQKFMHNSYLQIIGLGSPALSLIFRELRDRGGMWYRALSAITRCNPVPVEDRGNIKRMKEIWLQFGRENGYLQ
jgi:hypothetical protein